MSKVFLTDLVTWALNQKRHRNLAENLIKDFILWKWSTDYGKEKYKGCPFWSENAHKQFQKKKSFKGLRHDHIVPRTCLTKLLIEEPNQRKRIQILKVFGCACVLTIRENKRLDKKFKSRMPDNWDKKDEWARYREAFKKTGIKIMRTVGANKKPFLHIHSH